MPLTTDEKLLALSGEILEAFDKVNQGVHPGFRAAHAKGILLTGTFTPSSGAASLTRAPHLNRNSTPVTVRFSNFAGIPTVAEMLPGFEATAWHGIAAPRNTPADIVTRLNKEINAGLIDPAVKAKFANVGSETAPMRPDEFEKFIRDETEKWAKVIAFAGLKTD